MSSANSINIGRLLPQSIHFIHAAARLADIAHGEKVVFSVPSGNFGDMMGGMLAWRAGLPMARLVIATNANDEVPRFLKTGNYARIRPSRACISNAMNVGDPSNLSRLVHLYGGWPDHQGQIRTTPDVPQMRLDLFSESIDDIETQGTMTNMYRRHQLMLEPHGAVAWAGLERFWEAHPTSRPLTAVSLETAHPAKFPIEVRTLTGVEPPLPPSLAGLNDRPEVYGEMDVDYDAFREYLIREFGP